MSRRNATCVAVLLLSLSFAPAIGNAKPSRPPQTVSAQDRSAGLIAQGVLALASRNFAAAYAALSEAYLLDPSPDTLYQLGIVSYAEGRTVCSQDLMRRYLAISKPSEKSAQQRAEADRVVSQPQGQTSEIILSGSPDQQVFLDDRLVGILPLPLPLLVTAERHALVIKDKGKDITATVDAAPHRAYQVTIGNAEGKLTVATKSLLTTLLAIDKDIQVGLSATYPLVYQAISKAGAFVLPPIFSGREECKTEQRCMVGIAEQSYADYLLVFDGVQAAAASGGPVKLTLIDSQIGEVAASQTFSCSPCGDGALAESALSLIPNLIEQAASRGRGFLQVQSQPPGAAVQVGGRKLGTTPIRIPRFAGSLDLELTRPGYKPQKQHSEIRAGQTSELSVELAQEVVAPIILTLPPERRPRPTWRIAAGISSLGIGLGLVGFGIGALAISGTCVEAPMPPAENCPRLYETTTAGAALVGSGSLLSAAGILLLAIPGPRNKDLRPVPSDSSGPWALIP